jgi:hypothetical protein
MENIGNRSIFLKKIGLFSTLCLTGINESLADPSPPELSSDQNIKAEEGEVRFIGTTRETGPPPVSDILKK